MHLRSEDLVENELSHSELITAFAISTERRRKPRINGPFFAWIRGTDAGGDPFEERVLVDNLSAHGLYLCSKRNIPVDTILFIVLRLARTPLPGPAVTFAIRGRVLRNEPQGRNGCGVAMRFLSYRFL